MDETDFKAAIPKSALSFYVKLYCKKRKSTKCKVIKGHTVLMEATKSWLSLSKSEKDLFIAKYNDALMEYNKKVGEYLKNAEPYLKKRDHFRSKNLHLSQSNIGNQNQEPAQNNIENIFEGHSALPNLSGNIVSEILDTGREQTAQASGVNNLTIPERLPEPTPPTLKTAKELFEMLGRRDDNCLTWESLPTVEKRRYQNAVLSIKRNYITSYRKFLESLSHEELYNYYVNNKGCN